MDSVVKYKPQPHPQEFVYTDVPPEAAPAAPLGLFRALRRRWYIVFLVFVLLAGAGLPAVWFLVKPKYQAAAAIRVAPIIPSILFSDKDSEGVIPMYESFMNTQADIIVSDQVIQRVADELADKKLALFEDPDPIARYLTKDSKPLNPVVAIRQAIRDGIIAVVPGRKTELIKITMDSLNPKEAELVVDAFVRAYMNIEGSRSMEGGNKNLEVLESERKAIQDKIQRQQETIRKMGEEYGTIALTGRQDMMLARVSDLRQQLTQIESKKLALQSLVQLSEQTKDKTIVPEKLLERRYDFINSDPTLQMLTQRVAQLEETLVMAQQTLAPTNPEIEQQTKTLEAFKERTQKQREDLEKTFDEMVAKELTENSQLQLDKAKAELEQIIVQENILRDTLTKENADTIDLGRKQLAIQEQQDQLALNQELYETIRRRIQELEVERKRPARISVAYNASSLPLPSKRIKLMGAALFGALAAGIFLAFVRDKADKNLYTPEDLARTVGVAVVGTTSQLNYRDKIGLRQQLVSDYQTIRSNLRLLSDGEIPKILVVTSPASGDGKTTLAINLSLSLAQTGQKVLLIDGDLRKPDIAHFLKLPENYWGLQDVLLGLRRWEEAVYTLPEAGVQVLTADHRNNGQAIDQLARPETAEIIRTISQNYDHVIIDTPPVLAIPDALLWSKMADAVVLSSLAGHSNLTDFQETFHRLSQLHVRILGNVLANVAARHSYNRYGYGYGYGYGHKHNPPDGKQIDMKQLMLLLRPDEKKKDTSPSEESSKN
ncbi:MAG: Tyrosine-protein kinase YwqD [Planctomycetes bacterium ADurb.Bin412]|nr:MAG: Tyrosine-protein kinase YwqD [Planctomycetes bacterium ADurb.Bin412]